MYMYCIINNLLYFFCSLLYCYIRISTSTNSTFFCYLLLHHFLLFFRQYCIVQIFTVYLYFYAICISSARHTKYSCEKYCMKITVAYKTMKKNRCFQKSTNYKYQKYCRKYLTKYKIYKETF